MRKLILLIGLTISLFVFMNPVFAGRYYIPEIGRWAIPDPLDQYHSPYVYCGNNPLKFIDPTGLAAWEIKNEWNEDYTKQYQEYASKRAQEYKDQETKRSCEDFAFAILMDFAKENSLPLTVVTGSMKMDAASDDFSNFSDFKTEVFKRTGARDLQNSENTTGISLNDIAKGDILLNRRNGVDANHVQVATSVNQFAIGIHQGNSNFLCRTPGASRFLSANDPSSLFYTGTKIQMGVFNKTSGNYNNLTTGNITKNYAKAVNLISVRWNFLNWNK